MKMRQRIRTRQSGRPFRSQLSILALGLLLLSSHQGATAFVIPSSTRASLTGRAASPADKDKNEDEQPKSKLEKDIAKKLSISPKDRAISALSQPKDGAAPAETSNTDAAQLPSDKRRTNKRFQKKRGGNRGASKLLPQQPRLRDNAAEPRSETRRSNRNSNRNRRDGSNKNTNGNKKSNPVGKASLLPPPLSTLSDDDLTSGLSSWEEFLGQTNAPVIPERNVKAAAQLPTITDLFPPNPATSSDTKSTTSGNTNEPVVPQQPKPKNIKGMDGVLPVSELFYRSSNSLTDDVSSTGNGAADDEELPFSAEQTDALTTGNGSVQVRRNQASPQNTNTRRRSRKMVRRGMEMLVGGVPINVDPPQRSVELHYQLDVDDWAQAISLNSRDFGPLLHQTAKDVTALERGLYCESFVHNAIKWDVCPKDLREIVKNHHVQSAQRPSSYATLLDEVNAVTTTTKQDGNIADDWERDATAGDDAAAQEFLEHPDMPFQFQFSIEGVSKQELETVTDPASLGNVILKAIILIAKDKLLAPDFVLEANKLTLSEGSDESTTHVSLEFHFEAEGEEEDIMPFAQSIKPTMRKAVRDGTFAEALAEIATEESGWFEEVIDQISDEWVFSLNEQDGDQEIDDKAEKKVLTLDSNSDRDSDAGPFGMESRDLVTDDLFLDGGNGGVFFDYSAANVENAPFQGNLGPLLLDAAVERAKQRHPRVIAIGDVHGCIDELQDLLRLCDYQPGDLVCFLGDLVCKGPDSIAVVQMAREIGAIGVRGNHDFEVVRWYQAIQSGVDPPVVGSEHFHIASCLNKADMKWLYSLPWYISSKDLGALFVHAGLVAGIRLAKQNPRLMMNMRSILPDGTVTSKFFSNWPWARLWDGPQTVLFGHDADRGLQQYEHAIGLDTGCVYGGRLTACILPEKRLVSVSARREYFKYRRRHYD